MRQTSLMRIDLHTHSCVSDGTDTPAVLVAHAAAAGLDAMAMTDHDTFDGLPDAFAAAATEGIEVLGGLEFSTQWEGHSVHLLGYGPRVEDAALTAELARVREGRDARVPAMVAKLTALGYPLTLADVAAQAHGSSIGRPHIADAMVAHGYVQHRDEAFERFLFDGGPGFVDRYATPLLEALALVKGAGGVSVIAHPWSRGSRAVLPEGVIADLAAAGLDGLEVNHPDHDEATRAQLRDLAHRHDLLVTGGSDHHGTGKTRNPLGAGLTEPNVYAELKRRIASFA